MLILKGAMRDILDCCNPVLLQILTRKIRPTEVRIHRIRSYNSTFVSISSEGR
ncbi:unnamed protein product, partial [Larinioides sclopetarius]